MTAGSDTAHPGEAMVDAAAILTGAQNVLLSCHINPDGDTMGSALALGLALERAGKQVAFVCADEVPAPYRFLPGSERIQASVPATPFDVSVALDCDGPHRLGAIAAGVRRAHRVIEVDHHTGTQRFGHVVVVDSTAAATGELVFRLLRLLALPITAEIATNLYVAILTDTGSFRFANTTARSLHICAELVACGASPSGIAEQVYETRSFAATAILGRALTSMQVGEGGAVAWAKLSTEDFRAAGATDADTEGVVNHLRAIAGVKVAVLLRDTGDRVRVSLRSREPVDVAEVARVFNGGGHRVAAGCSLSVPLEQAEQQVLAEVRKVLARA